MGYYMAGGTGTVVDRGLYASHTSQTVDAPSNQTPPQDRPRKKRQVIDLTALRHAFRRIERATGVAHRLFSMKKAGTHGLKFKKHHRRKKGI